MFFSEGGGRGKQEQSKALEEFWMEMGRNSLGPKKKKKKFGKGEKRKMGAGSKDGPDLETGFFVLGGFAVGE